MDRKNPSSTSADLRDDLPADAVDMDEDARGSRAAIVGASLIAVAVLLLPIIIKFTAVKPPADPLGSSSPASTQSAPPTTVRKPLTVVNKKTPISVVPSTAPSTAPTTVPVPVVRPLTPRRVTQTPASVARAPVTQPPTTQPLSVAVPVAPTTQPTTNTIAVPVNPTNPSGP